MIRNALEWKAVAQEYRNQKGIMQDVDARRYGALFFAQIPGGFLFKSVSEGGTSLAFVPKSEDTKGLEKLHLDRHAASDEMPDIIKYEQQMFGLQEAGKEALEVEAWLLRFHDGIQPSENDRVRAGHDLIDALEKLDGKGGISIQKDRTKPLSPLVTIADQGPVVVRYDKGDFFVIDEDGDRQKVHLVYDPVSKSYRGPAHQGQRGSPGIQVLIQAAWNAIQSQKNKGIS